MNILCIHYYYPPLRSTAVIRNYHFSQAFAELFPQVHVLTSDNYRRFPTEERHLAANITVHDIYTLDYRTAMGKKGGKDAHISMEKKSSAMVQYLLKIQKSHPFSMLIGEGNLLYIHNAFKKAAKLIEQEMITTIYSSFAPYADHLVAYKLKKKFPHLRWIADFRDLQVEPIYENVIWKKTQRRMEAKILAAADKVISISESYADQLSQYNNNTQSVMRGVQLRDPTKQYDKFTISYTGSLYFNHRDPNRLLKELSDMIATGELSREQIQLLYAGRDGQQFGKWVADHGLADIYVDKGMVSQTEAKEIQDRSHINLLLTSSSPELKGVITGKVFEYFEAGNPIICLINGVQDEEFEQLFKKLNAGIVVYAPAKQGSSLKEFIKEKYLQLHHYGSVQHIINKSVLIDEYSWLKQAKKLLS